MAAGRRTRFTAEEAADLVFAESSDEEDDLDELFTPDEFFEDDEDDDEENGDDHNGERTLCLPSDSDGDEGGDSTGAAGGSSRAARKRSRPSRPPSSPSSPPSSPSSPPSSPPPKRPRTKKRLVCGIDEALDPQNYDELDIPAGGRTFTARLGPAKKKNVEKITWTDEQPGARGRQRQCDVLRGTPGLRTTAAKSVESMRDAFELFVTPEMIDIVVTNTNKRIAEVLENLPEETKADDRLTHYRSTDACEMYALIGLMYFRGLLGLNNRGVTHIFSDRMGHPVFGGAMSRNRFSFLLGHLCFDDADTRRQRWETDRFAAFREFFSKFNDQCSTQMVPSEYLSLDETLYPMRTQIAFKQYNPDKPAKCVEAVQVLKQCPEQLHIQVASVRWKAQEPSLSVICFRHGQLHQRNCDAAEPEGLHPGT